MELILAEVIQTHLCLSNLECMVLMMYVMPYSYPATAGTYGRLSLAYYP